MTSQTLTTHAGRKAETRITYSNGESPTLGDDGVYHLTEAQYLDLMLNVIGQCEARAQAERERLIELAPAAAIEAIRKRGWLRPLGPTQVVKDVTRDERGHIVQVIERVEPVAA